MHTLTHTSPQLILAQRDQRAPRWLHIKYYVNIHKQMSNQAAPEDKIRNKRLPPAEELLGRSSQCIFDLFQALRKT